MALMKCPECGREVSDRTMRCSYCGVDIQEIETCNAKNKKNTIFKKIVLVVICLIVLFVCINIARGYLKMEQFEGYVDEFVHDWDRMVEASREEPKDLLLLDSYEKVLCIDMKHISQSYVDFDDKTRVNDYLEKHTFKDMYEYVMELIKDNPWEISIDQEFIDFYSNMKR